MSRFVDGATTLSVEDSRELGEWLDSVAKNATDLASLDLPATTPEDLWKEEQRWNKLESHPHAVFLPDREYFTGLCSIDAGLVRQVWRVNADALDRPGRFSHLSLTDLELRADQGDALGLLGLPLPVLDRIITDCCTTGRLSTDDRYLQLWAIWSEGCMELASAMRLRSNLRYHFMLDLDLQTWEGTFLRQRGARNSWRLRSKNQGWHIPKGFSRRFDAIMAKQGLIAKAFASGLAELARSHCE